LVSVLGYVALGSPKPAATDPVLLAIKTAPVTTGPLERVIRVSGQTAARNYGNVLAPMIRGPEGNRPMTIMKMVKSGALVKKGEVVVEIDPGWLLEHLDDVKATVEQAESDVLMRKAEHLVDWENLQQTLRVAKADYDKAKLDASAAEVRTEVERLLLQLAEEEAAAHYKQLQTDVKYKKISQESDLKVLQYTADRHRRHLGRHTADLAKYTIRAPMDGLAVLNSIYRGGGESQPISEGDNIFPGQLVMKIVDASSMQVEATINQSESSQFRIGQKAVIGLDAFPGLTFEGRVHSIGALAVGGWRQNYYIRTVPIKLAIIGSDPRLIPDLSASCDVMIERVDQATLIPAGAVTSKNGKDFVTVKTGSGLETREVRLGARNQTHFAVESGVSPGEQVRVN
jgi:multidrug efflux pump subunit AcrA (membrane-fusion protein)